MDALNDALSRFTLPETEYSESSEYEILSAGREAQEHMRQRTMTGRSEGHGMKALEAPVTSGVRVLVTSA